jgi:hypothetical protein
MPEFEISWEVRLSKNSPGPLTPPSERDLAAAYPAIVERFPLISVTTDGGRTGVIKISQRTSAGNARTAALYIRSGNPFASDAGIAHVLADSSIDVVVSDLTVTNAESGEITVQDKGQYRPAGDDEGQVGRSGATRGTRRRSRRTVIEPDSGSSDSGEPEIYLHHVVEAEAEEPVAEDPLVQYPEAEEPVAEPEPEESAVVEESEIEGIGL